MIFFVLFFVHAVRTQQPNFSELPKMFPLHVIVAGKQVHEHLDIPDVFWSHADDPRGNHHFSDSQAISASLL